MKFVRITLTWLGILAVIAAVIWGSFELKERNGHEPEEEEEHAAEEKKPLDEEAIERLGLEMTDLAAASWKDETVAFGRAVDPAPLALLHSDWLAAAAALKASQAEVDRARKLFEGGENIARKALEQAEAAVTADQLKVQAVEQRMALEWGPAIRDRVLLEGMADAILAGELTIFRAELASAEEAAETPGAARIMVPGRHDAVPVSAIYPAPALDPKTQRPAWLLTVEKQKAGFPAGLSVEVRFAGEEKSAGVLIPEKAVLHFQGRTWVYKAGEKKGEFEREPVDLDHPLDGGWFVEEDFKPGDKVVTTGAASLLADELKAQIEGD